MNIPATPISDVIEELPGAVDAQMTTALASIAASVMATGKKGQIVLTFDVSPAKDTKGQCVIAHKLATTVPTERGHIKEAAADKAAFYVAPSGALSVTPHNQLSLPGIAARHAGQTA